MRRDQGDDRARAQADARDRGGRRRHRRGAARRGVGVGGPRRVAAAAALAGLLIVGCGGGGDDSREEAREVAERYVEALREGDAEAACEVLSRGAVAQLEDEARAGCPEALGEALGAVGPEAGDLDELRVTDVNVAGDVATATIKGGPTGEVTNQLVREGGEWKLASPGG